VRALKQSWLDRGLWCSASVGWSLPTAAERWPDRVALVLGEQRLTFAQLLARVEAVGAEFVDRGTRPGDRVVVQLPNCVELVVVIMAAWHIGAVAVPVVPLYRQREMAHILSVTAPVVVVAAAVRGDRRPAAELDEVMPGSPARYAVGDVSGWGALPTVPRSAPHRPAGADECCLLLFTSGTTSDPKGVRHNSRSLLCQARSYRDEALLGASSPVLIPAPVAHIGAAVACTLLPCLTGAQTVVLESWNADTAVTVCDRERVALAIGAPVFLSEMLDRYAAPSCPAHRIAMFHTGAAPTGSTVIRRAHDAGITAWRAWGMTEAPTMTSGHPDDPLHLREGTDGRIDTGCEVRAVGEDGVPLPSGTPGELQIRGPKLMMGYLDPAQDAFDTDGWFATGDIGTVDADGCVTIRGRIKDIINRGGEKFSAAEIETAIATHPAVEAVAVVGVPHERLGEQVAAFVTVRTGAEWPGDQALLAHLEAAHLARQKLPVVWQVLSDFPRTPTGKIQKRELLADWTAGRSVGGGAITSAL
jgi:acyl-CoA synthetase (AMP-forming)/AMP-acid ligase II